MELKTKGKAVNIQYPIVAKITRDPYLSEMGYVLISKDDNITNGENFAAIVSTATLPLRNGRYVHEVKQLDHLFEGDIVVINTDGVINTMYRVNSFQNFILATERCNSNCLMCSQPPRDKEDIPYLHSLHKQLIPLIPKDCIELGITGGEPTLMGEAFFELLAQIKYELPDTDLHCLTNGRSFAWKGFADRLGALDLKRLMLGIPLYSDFDQVHDYIVQAKGAYQQTLQGIYNLEKNKVRVEIRIVLHKQTIPRLVKLAKFIYKNLPFVEHITFMGLEHQGYTAFNLDKLWIDPIEYMDSLGEAVEFLSDKDMNVSIYNSQLCLMPKELWPYNRKSISDWKNIYLEDCSSCSVLHECGGLFASGEKMHSSFIKALI